MLSENLIDDLEQIEDESSHILHFWSPFETNITKAYEFLPDGLLFTMLSTALSYFAYGILRIFNRIVFDFKVVGKENLKLVKGRKNNRFKSCSSYGLYNDSVFAIFQIPLTIQLLNLILEFQWCDTLFAYSMLFLSQNLFMQKQSLLKLLISYCKMEKLCIFTLKVPYGLITKK